MGQAALSFRQAAAGECSEMVVGGLVGALPITSSLPRQREAPRVSSEAPAWGHAPRQRSSTAGPHPHPLHPGRHLALLGLDFSRVTGVELRHPPLHSPPILSLDTARPSGLSAFCCALKHLVAQQQANEVVSHSPGRRKIMKI